MSPFLPPFLKSPPLKNPGKTQAMLLTIECSIARPALVEVQQPVKSCAISHWQSLK